MKMIKLDEVSPGMILAQPVLDSRGSLIVGEGTELTADLVDRLRERNVMAVFVTAGDGSDGDGKLDPEAYRQKLDDAFADVSGDPIMDSLRAAVEDFRLGGEGESD